jgi:hypothetical protein
LVWHLTEQQIDAVAMKRPLDEEAAEHLNTCQICVRRVNRTVDLIRALRAERKLSIEPARSRYRRQPPPSSDT